MSTLLALGSLDAEWQRTVDLALGSVGWRLVSAPNVEGLSASTLAEVHAVVLGTVPGGLLEAAQHLRAEPRLERTALFAVYPEVSAADYVTCVTAGIDDLLAFSGDVSGLVQRLEAASEASAGPSRALRRGLAAVVGPSAQRALAVSRALAGAGFRASVAEAGGEPWLTERRLALAIWQPDDAESAVLAVRAARAAGVLCRFVLCLPGEQASRVAAECESLEGVRVLPISSPPDSVVFLANEMAEMTVQNQRASRRRLASALVRFQSGGRADLGLSYNVSAGGLYVRTLAPPGSGSVELAVGVGSHMANLSCEVAWSRSLSHDGTATAPPGFGVKIVAAGQDARELLATLGGP